jgi:hypothetical protein
LLDPKFPLFYTCKRIQIFWRDMRHLKCKESDQTVHMSVVLDDTSNALICYMWNKLGLNLIGLGSEKFV